MGKGSCNLVRLGGAGLGLLVPSGWCLGVVHGCGVAWFEGVCGWEGGGVTEFREALAQATVLLGELAHLDRSVLSDADLVVLLEAEEAAGRLVDAGRVFTAAEIAERSRHEFGMEGLSSRYSHRKPVDFIEYRTRVSKAEAARRVRVGAALRARRSPSSVNPCPRNGPCWRSRCGTAGSGWRLRGRSSPT